MRILCFLFSLLFLLLFALLGSLFLSDNKIIEIIDIKDSRKIETTKNQNTIRKTIIDEVNEDSLIEEFLKSNDTESSQKYLDILNRKVEDYTTQLKYVKERESNYRNNTNELREFLSGLILPHIEKTNFVKYLSMYKDIKCINKIYDSSTPKVKMHQYHMDFLQKNGQIFVSKLKEAEELFMFIKEEIERHDFENSEENKILISSDRNKKKLFKIIKDIYMIKNRCECIKSILGLREHNVRFYLYAPSKLCCAKSINMIEDFVRKIFKPTNIFEKNCLKLAALRNEYEILEIVEKVTKSKNLSS